MGGVVREGRQLQGFVMFNEAPAPRNPFAAARIIGVVWFPSCQRDVPKSRN
jgi:hypothetical protein